MGDLVFFSPTPRTELRKIMRTAHKEAVELYRLTSGFWFLPLPPDEEAQEMIEMGLVETPWLLPEDI